MSATAADPLLSIRDLKVHFVTDDGMIRAVDGVSIDVGRKETVCVVGESGCGKTVTAMTVLKLIAMPPGRIAGGQILWQGRDLVPLKGDAMRPIRAKEIAIVFQEPMTSLNPVYTVGEQIAEVVRQQEGLGKRAAMDRAKEMLSLVHIPNAARRANDYPHHEGTWPHSAEAIERTMPGLNDTQRAKILGLNAARLFKLEVPAHQRLSVS